ncbi:MAG: hypothetical protein SNF68_00715 [Rikenellaceae bacterium]
MNRFKIQILLIVAFVASSCSALIYEPMTYESDGMYAAHDKDEIIKNQSVVWYFEYEEPSYTLYRYDWWGYRPMYGHPRHFGRYSHRYRWGYPFYYSTYSFGWNYPYYNSWEYGWDDPFYTYYDPFYGSTAFYSSPFWYSSCFYYDWFYFGHAHAPQPGGGSSSKSQSIVRKADAYNSPSSRSESRNADGSTVGRSSSSESYYNRNSSTRSSGYTTPTRVTTPSTPSSSGGSTQSIQRNSIGR